MIDFTKPFMNLGISILFKKPELRQAELFSFMNPLGMNIIILIRIHQTVKTDIVVSTGDLALHFTRLSAGVSDNMDCRQVCDDYFDTSFTHKKIISRFSPNEWSSPHPCVDSGYIVQNDFTLANSFWFTVID